MPMINDNLGRELLRYDHPGYVSTVPHLFNVARGVQHITPDGDAVLGYGFSVFGHNADIGSDWETLYRTSNEYTFLSSAEQLSLVSDDANDDLGDTGAEKVTVYGLDANYAEQSEEVDLDGTTTVYTTNSYLRLQDARVTQAGSSGYNEGTITIANNAETNTLATIQPEEGQDHCCVWTVPAGYTAYITQWHASSGDDKLTKVHLVVRNYGEVQLHRKGTLFYGGGHFHHSFQIPLSAPEKSDIQMMVQTGVGAGNVQGGFEGWYE